MAKVPITPAVLQWAVDAAGSDARRLAAATERSEALAQGWLDGNDKPHGGDLKKIAIHLGRPPQFFLRRSIPATQTSFLVSYRTSLIDAETAAPEEDAVVREADAIRRLSSWLSSQEGLSPWELPEPTESSLEFSKILAKWFDWDVRENQIKVSKTQTFKLLRAALENCGVVVLLKDLGEHGSRGFSLHDARTPVVVVNSHTKNPALKNPAQRTYTLLHEIGHLVRGESNLRHDEGRKLERWCDRLAAEFLIPDSELSLYMQNYRRLDAVDDDDLETVRLVSGRFNASWLSAAIRLKNLGFAGEGLVQTVKDTYEPVEPGFLPGGLNRAERRANEFGTSFPSLLAAGIEQASVGSLDARRYLRLSSEAEFSELRELIGLGA